MNKSKSIFTILCFSVIAVGFQNCAENEFANESIEMFSEPEGNVTDMRQTCSDGNCVNEVIVASSVPKKSVPVVSRPLKDVLPGDKVTEPVDSFSIQPQNTCSMYQVYKGPSARGGYSLVTRINNNTIKETVFENYVFGVYNATDASHGPGKVRKMAEMKIMIPPGAKPVNLFLFAYEPTIWTIVGAANRVDSVNVQGYHCQTVKNLPKSADALVSYVADGGLNKRYSVTNGSHAKMLDAGVDYFKKQNRRIIKAQYIYQGVEINQTFRAEEKNPKIY